MPAGSSPEDDRLREQLVQAIVAGTHPQYTPEQLWALQFRNQRPPPPPVPNNRLMERPSVPSDPTAHTPMPVVVPDRFTYFAAVPDIPPEPPDPFPGVVEGGGTVERVGPYQLPKKPEKKKGKG
jgi:hypothetical protein